MSLREKRLLLRLGIHSAMLALLLIWTLTSALGGNSSSASLVVVIMFMYLATLRVNPMPRLLERRFLQDTECPHCGEIIDLVGTWACGCGFVTWKPRHGLSPCPDCRKVYDRLQCPRCDASIKT